MATPDRGAIGADTFSLRPVGWGRYIDVVFLGVWLAGWVVGEVFGLALMGGFLAALGAGVFGITLSFAPRVAPDGSAPFFLLFALVWLTLWSVGGIGALTHFLRSAAGLDILSVSPAGLELERRAGPFRRRRTIPRASLRRLRMRDGTRNATLVVDTASGSVDLTTLGTRDDRVALMAWLRERLAFPDEAEVKRLEAEIAPPGWDVDVHPTETHLARPTRHTRAIQAAILWTLAGLVSTGVISARHADRLTGAHIAAGVLTLLIALWATWTTWGRSEWLVRDGRLTWHRRFGTWRRETPFDHAAIELLHAVDSDGDDRFTLRVRSATARRTIATALYDATELGALAEWLSARTRFPIERRSP
jgi:hypothetical protein